MFDRNKSALFGLENEAKAQHIIDQEVLIAERGAKMGKRLGSGQVEKIMTNISKLLLKSKALVKTVVLPTVEVRDQLREIKERNVRRYINWAEIEFYEINEFIERF